MTVRLGHGGVFDRHQFAQGPVRHHHPADVLRQMPRKAEQLLTSAQSCRATLRLWVEA